MESIYQGMPREIMSWSIHDRMRPAFLQGEFFIKGWDWIAWSQDLKRVDEKEHLALRQKVRETPPGRVDKIANLLKKQFEVDEFKKQWEKL